MHKISVKRKIKSSYAKVWSVLWEIKSWTKFWSPAHKVDILYDDGMHQDFVMFLEWQASNTYIRTVRFLDDRGNIAFFSPMPPHPMTIHHGLWQLALDDSEGVELIAIRWFKIPFIERETLEGYQKRLKDFSDGFTNRLESLLKCLGELCEKPM